jgi:hypothetical protein
MLLETFRNNLISSHLSAERLHLKKISITNLFKNIDNLISVTLSNVQEYDDSNYYSRICVTKINGIDLEDEEDYYYEEGKVYDSSDKIVSKNFLIDKIEIQHIVAEAKEYADTVSDFQNLTLHRKDFVNRKTEKFYNKVFCAYYAAYITGQRLKNESILIKNPSIALCYAYDVIKGRLDPSLEDCLKEDFYLCFLYATEVLKHRLPLNLENYFKLKSFKSFNESEKYHYKVYKEFLESLVTQS